MKKNNFKFLNNFYENNFSTPEKRAILKTKSFDVFSTILRYFILYGLAFIILFPIIQQIAVSLRRPEDINNPLVLWIPETYSFSNFTITSYVLDYWKAFGNSFLLSFLVTILQLITTAFAGYSLARLKFKGRKIVFILVLITVIVVPSMIEVPLRLRLKNTLLGKSYVLYIFAFLGLGIKSGLFILIFRQFFKGLPIELEEAAYIDGANPLQVFYKVMLPNVKGAILLTGILTFVWQWNDSYYTETFITKVNSNFYTLTTKMLGALGNIKSAVEKAGITSLVGQDVSNNPFFTSMILNTAAILVMLPLIIIYLLVQKKLFEKGIERTGIVG